MKTLEKLYAIIHLHTASGSIGDSILKIKDLVKKAKKLNIPVVAMVDTNCDPDEVDYVIPSNDDAIRAVRLMTSKMADAVLEAQKGVSDQEVAEEQNIDLTEEETTEEVASTEE